MTFGMVSLCPLCCCGGVFLYTAATHILRWVCRSCPNVSCFGIPVSPLVLWRHFCYSMCPLCCCGGLIYRFARYSAQEAAVMSSDSIPGISKLSTPFYFYHTQLFFFPVRKECSANSSGLRPDCATISSNARIAWPYPLSLRYEARGACSGSAGYRDERSDMRATAPPPPAYPCPISEPHSVQ